MLHHRPKTSRNKGHLPGDGLFVSGSLTCRCWFALETWENSALNLSVHHEEPDWPRRVTAKMNGRQLAAFVDKTLLSTFLFKGSGAERSPVRGLAARQ
jgi:hypothetical protein